MKRQGPGWTTVDRHLFWLVLQVVLVLPIALGQSTLEQWAESGPSYRALAIVIGAVVGFFILRNLARLVWAPPREACGSNVIQLVVVGLVFTLFSTGPLIESDRWSVKPGGYATAFIGGLLLLLAGREVHRVRSRRSRRPEADAGSAAMRPSGTA